MRDLRDHRAAGLINGADMVAQMREAFVGTVHCDVEGDPLTLCGKRAARPKAPGAQWSRIIELVDCAECRLVMVAMGWVDA